MMTEECVKTREQIEYDLTNAFRDIDKIYRQKKRKLLENFFIQREIESFWNLLPKDFNWEIEKRTYISLFSKIYLLLLPKFNHEEIPVFVENEWESNNKGKQKMDYKLFSKALFRIPHLWCTHTHKDEYVDFLKLIYNRITRIAKFSAEGKEQSFEAEIKIVFYDVLKAEDYEKSTWEISLPEEEEDELYDYQDTTDSDHNIVKKKRPALDENLIPKQDVVIYSEEADFSQEATRLGELESYRRVLLSDEEIVIYGYPTQFILTHFKNNLEEMKNLLKAGHKNYVFRINNKKIDQSFEVKFENLAKIIEIITNSKEIILRRDFFFINNDIHFGRDFLEEDLGVMNNFQRNPVIDRRLHFQEILSNFCF